MLISAVGVASVIVLERFVSVGLFDFERELRVSGPCMSMHIGDQHVDAYWSLALPFIFQFRYQRRWQTFVLCLLQAATLYAVFSTMSRATIAAALVAIVSLAIARLTWFRRPELARPDQLTRHSGEWSRVPMTLAALATMALLGGTLWMAGEAVPKRFAQSLGGWQERTKHWSTFLNAPQISLWERCFGLGLGSFPYHAREVLGRVRQPIRLEKSDSKTAVRIYSGESIYFEQLVNPRA